jgi:hypothetical protein
MSTHNTAPATSTSPLSERISKLTWQISQQEASINRSSKTMGTIGVIALIAISIYFYIGYQIIAEILEPKVLVQAGSTYLEQNLAPARQALVKQIRDSSPAWAEQVSLMAQEALPNLRSSLEEYILTETDALMVQVATLAEDKFRKAIQENRELVERGFKELAASEKLSEETLAALVVALEQELKADLRDQSELLLETLRFLSARVRKLAAGVNLDEEEKCERRIAMLARRLQLEEADPNPIKPPAIEIASPNSDPATKPAPDSKVDDKDTTDQEKSEKPAANQDAKPAKEEKSEPKSESATKE